MLTEAQSVPTGTLLSRDVCVVGAGAAGITLARALKDRGLRVCLLESGALAPDDATSDLNRGHVEPGQLPAGSSYLSDTRLRFFGGTTNHWVGVCGPFAPVDFEERDWIPNSGWPLTRAELDPYYSRATSIVQIRDFDYDPARLQRPPLRPLPGSDLETEVRHFSPPTRFGQQFRSELAEATDVEVFLGANVVDLRTDPGVRRVERVEVATLAGNRFTVRARRVVLATGGVENARLLLSATRDDPKGLGNRHDVVGRYFMDHVFRLGDPGRFVLDVDPSALALYEAFAADAFLRHLTWGRFTLSREAQRRHRVPHHGIGLGRVPFPEPGADLALSLGRLGTDLTRTPDDAAAGRDRGRPAHLGTLGLDLEMTPDPDNRVVLGDERDALGLRRPVLRWRLTDDDRRQAVRFLEAFAAELGRALPGRGQVRLRPDFDPTSFQFSAHHVGTTRMHADPKRGVVDANARVHGLDNLYVAGSSVFPTSGLVNPTFTLVALTLRLADHLLESGGGDR